MIKDNYVIHSPTLPKTRSNWNSNVLEWSWVGLIGALYSILAFFCIDFAMRMASRYLFTSPKTWTTLPGLGEPVFPALGIYLHFWGGFLLLWLSLIQILPISRWNMTIHRYIGRVYVIAGLLTPIGGLTFIVTHRCVGGLNMDIAFSIAGITMFVCACYTWKYARQHNRKLHRNWAIRLWSQGIASLLYRVWYFILQIVFNYETKSWADFHRPIDEVLDWWFFVPNLIVAEIVIRYLNYRDEIRLKNELNTPLLHNDTKNEY